MLTKVFANIQKDPCTGQYVRCGDRHLSIMKSSVNENKLVFSDNEKSKTVMIHESDEFVYQIRKDYINAIGGAAGLYEFLKRELADSPTGGFYLTIFNKVFEYMR